MSAKPEEYVWSPDVLAQWYNAIKYNSEFDADSFRSLKLNINHVLVVPKRNEKSRSSLAAADAGPVTLHNGQQFKFNQAFVAAASQLASELDFDELSAAELLQEASAARLAQGADLLNSGLLAFFRRYTYIVNILGYYVTENAVDKLSDPATLLQSILDSFKQIYSLVALQNDLIDKQKATGDVNGLQFVNRATYVRKQLFDIHDLLAQCLYSLVDVCDIDSFDAYNKIVAHINEHVKDDGDSLLLHYLPALVKLTYPDSNEVHIGKFHQAFSTALSADYAKISTGDEIDVSKTSLRPYTVLVQLFFFISFIPWCKGSPARTQKYDFEKDILKYVEWLINYGALEQALCYTAETADAKTKIAFEQNKLFDLRPLLQKTFPVLRPTKFLYPGTEQLLHVVRTNHGYQNLAKLCDYSNLKVSSTVSEDLIAPFFHTFFFNFITHAAIVLTSIRDSEEDFLLSSINRKGLDSDPQSNSSSSYDARDSQAIRKSLSEHSSSNDGESSLDLDEIATRAELERFYLAFAYTYSNRPQLCEAFWASEGSNITGFLTWGLANNTSPLITSTFCVLMGSLTFGGDHCSRRIWDTLIQSQDGIYKRNDYSKISIDSILSSLTYYIDALTENLESDLSMQARKAQEKPDLLFSSAKVTNVPSKPISLQLSEDSVVFIAGFLNLISAVVENAKSDTNTGVRQAAFARFQPIITSLLKFDNLITSAKVLSTERKFSPVVFNDENRTTIINLIMSLLTNFADGESDLDLRCKIWSIVDRWICHSLTDTEPSTTSSTEPTRYTGVSLVSPSSSKSEIAKLKAVYRGITMKHGFQIAFTNISEVLNFSRLLEKLLEKPQAQTFENISLLYPPDLGSSYRYKNEIGVWPYLEYLSVELFGKSTELKDETLKRELQRTILKTISSSLKSVDWNLYDESAPTVLNDYAKVKDNFANAIMSSGDKTVLAYSSFVRLHHSLAVLNFMFDQKVSEALFSIVNHGVDEIFESSDLENLVITSVDCLHQILYLQNVFIKSLLPTLTRVGDLPDSANNANGGYGTNMSLLLATPRVEYDNIYYPSNIGTKGVFDYYEIILFHIASVANIALYVGSSNTKLAVLSVDVLKQISQSSTFVSSSFSTKRSTLQPNRLLSVLQSVDESERIKYSFVQQLQSVTESLEPKYKVLQFIIDSLPETNDITVAHFLLGFSVRANFLSVDSKSQYALLLETLISLLSSTMKLITETEFREAYNFNIEYEPMRLSSMIMEIIIRLCRNQNSSKVTLAYLRKFDLFETLLKFQPRLDAMTTWNGIKFDGEMSQSSTNQFVSDDKALDTFFAFISFRNSALQYLSFELHDIKSMTQKDIYIGSLLDGSEFLDGTPKILGFLDVLNYQFVNLEEYKVSEFDGKYDLPALLSYMKKEEPHASDRDDMVVQLTQFKCEVANVNLPDDASRKDYMTNAIQEGERLDTIMQKYMATCDLKSLHSKTLHSWVQIIQVLTNDVANKLNFISQVMQMILPKINNEYYDRENSFAEELISLCVYLFELYEDEIRVVKQGDGKQHHLHGVLPLFKTCINGLLCSNSTPGLRADLYLLLNKFIQRSFKSKDLLSEVLATLRSSDRKFLEVVCNDSIYSEGVPRITSIILMESLVHLSIEEGSPTILNALLKNNSLSLLIRSLKRADETISACSERSSKNESGVNINTLLYELTAFKTTLYLLIRIAQTRSGASQLVQNEIFSVIKGLKFLSVDADLGLNFYVESSEEYGDGDASLHLALDVPLSLRGRKFNNSSQQNETISFYEILVPSFQLIVTILLSLGPSYRPGILQVEELMKHFHPFVVSIMKRDTLVESNQIDSKLYEADSVSRIGLESLTGLVTLIDTILSGAPGEA